MAQCLAILAPSGRDSTVIRGILDSAQVQTCVETTVSGVLSAMDEVRAGGAVIAEEALSDEGLELVECWLSRQPPWSDLPIILLTKGRSGPETKLNIAGRLSRQGHAVHVRHVAEVLAGMTDDAPPIGETRAAH